MVDGSGRIAGGGGGRSLSPNRASGTAGSGFGAPAKMMGGSRIKRYDASEKKNVAMGNLSVSEVQMHKMMQSNSTGLSMFN